MPPRSVIRLRRERAERRHSQNRSRKLRKFISMDSVLLNGGSQGNLLRESEREWPWCLGKMLREIPHSTTPLPHCTTSALPTPSLKYSMVPGSKQVFSVRKTKWWRPCAPSQAHTKMTTAEQSKKDWNLPKKIFYNQRHTEGATERW